MVRGSRGGWSNVEMPLARYFFCVGAVLLALLFVLDAYLPKLPAADGAEAAAVLPAVRIQSDRKWPDRIVFDTSIAPIVPVALAKRETSMPAQVTAADLSADARVRETFAQFVAIVPKRPETKPQRQRRIAKNRVGPPTVLAAQQPRSGFFGNRVW
jgi:hypothetical protein